MQTHLLKRVHPNKKRMVVARGGKRGKTSGRGGKGQSARAGNKRRPEWRDIIKRLPKLRGRGKNSNKSVMASYEKPLAVNIGAIGAAYKAGETVNPASLVEKGVVSVWSGRIPRIKILGGGEITISLRIIECGVSESAKAAIEKAGGTIVPIKVAVEAPVRAEANVEQSAKAAPAPKSDKTKSDTKKKPSPKKPSPKK